MRHKALSVFSRRTAVVIIFFLYYFPVMTNYFGNSAVNSTTTATTSHLAIPVFGQQQSSLPQLDDEALSVEPLIEEKLLLPTGMVFVDNDTILVTQKNDGNVIAIVNGTLKSEPAISVEVNNEGLKGLLAIAAMEKPASSSHTKFVFLYFTESNAGGDQTRNRVYRYEWNQENQVLVNGSMILDLPAERESIHNGGKLEADKNGNLYAVIGDLGRDGQLQNVPEGPAADDTSVIFRIIQNGSGASDNPFSKGSNERMQKYYAYGIRNSFGLAIDPVSGLLWDTENGPDSYDEMNIVHPGFNSGWNKITGPIPRSGTAQADLEEELMIYDGSKYADPIFSWKDPVGLTALEFLNSTALGPKYAYNLFVGDINNGNLYYFELNDNRTGIKFDANELEEDLTDQVADDDEELSQIVFGSDFEGGITDIETGPDGFLYVLTFNGSIYRILPATD
jgi:aldose sugar dehydrogenase